MITTAYLLLVVVLLQLNTVANAATSAPTTSTPSAIPTRVPSQEPTPRPSFVPSMIPTSRPTVRPVSSSPTGQPSGAPSGVPSGQPSAAPSSLPSVKPTSHPSSYPTSFPTAQPSGAPSDTPTGQPSGQPSGVPTTTPSMIPSAQPFANPTSVPSVQPTSAPSMEPTSQPSVQPSMQPFAHPSALPTTQPTSIPSMQPNSHPTCQPTRQPSGSPTSQPTGAPSLQPSAIPTSQPTSPTSHPTAQPSRQPTSQPTIMPSTAPTNLPTTQPSSFPTMQPSSSPTQQPSVQPSSAPSRQPTSKPSQQPSLQPSSMPSTIPTSAPSEIPPCPAGTYYEFDFNSPGNYRCVNCGFGKSSNASSTICFDCPAGTYASLENSPECTPCPVNSYQPNSGSESCNSCGPGSITNQEGSTNSALCVNPSTNFILGALSLVVVLISSWIYLVDGRLLKVGFLRRYILIERAYIYFGRILEVVEMLSSTNSIINSAVDTSQHKETSRWKTVLFYILSIVIVPIIIIFFIFMTMIQIVFNGMVIWRGYVGVFHLPNDIRQQIHKVAEIADNLLGIQVFQVLGYPLAYIIGALSSLQIDLTTVNVTCVGAQVPFYLLINIFIVGIIIIVVKSELQVFWTACISALCAKSFRVLFNPVYLTSKTSTALWHAMLGAVVMLLPNPSNVIQYFLGFVSATKFFAQNGRSRSDANCDAATSFPVDTMLAIGTTCCAVLILFPIVYMISQVLVPCFKPRYFTESFEGCCSSTITTAVEVNQSDLAEKDDQINIEEVHADIEQRPQERTKATWYPKLAAMPSYSKPWSMIEEYDDSYKPGIYSRLNVFSFDRLLVKMLCIYGRIVFRAHKAFVRNPPVADMGEEELKQIKELLYQNAVNVTPIDIDDCDTAWLNIVEPQLFTEDVSLPEYWNQHKKNSPSYRKFISQVYADSPSKPDQAIFPVRAISYFLSWTFPGQCLTVHGWGTWVRVLRNYYIIILVSIGIWPEAIVEEFQLLTEYKDFYYKINMHHRIAASKVATNFDIFRAIEMDGKIMFASYLSAKVVTRLVLIQLIPALTIWSIFAVSVADCPIFVFSDKLREELPPLIDWNPLKTIELEYEGTIEHLELWKKMIIAARVFIVNSRLIRFVLAVLSSAVSIGMVFFPNSFGFLVIILVITLLILGAILGFYFVVLLHNFMFPRHDDHRKEGRSRVANEEEGGQMELILQDMADEAPVNAAPSPGFDPFEVDIVLPESSASAPNTPDYNINPPDAKGILEDFARRNQKPNAEKWLMDDYEELMQLTNGNKKINK